MQVKTVVVDTDAGADDLLAIYYLIKAKKYRNIKIVANYGIFSREECLSRISYFLSLIKTDKKIEIFLGEKQPLKGKFLPFYHIHGNKWINKKPIRVNQINNNSFNDKFDYLSIGPLTNLSKLIKNNNFLKKINKLLIMGGAILTPGNATPLAEANFYWDPIAVEQVLLKLSEKIVLVPLNITEKIQLNLSDLKTEPLKTFFKPYLNYYIKNKKFFFTEKLEKTKYIGAAVHDLLAAILLEHQQQNSKKKLYLSTKLIKKEPGFIFPVFNKGSQKNDKIFAVTVVDKVNKKLIDSILNEFFKK
ncbi:MAG: nucleoside hydrolase [Candidatus Pacebacteria bacterium]|nr:nucleoside hydrolase [Candidatus Paceibacterota bacterium]